jgi:hypothetical protein
VSARQSAPRAAKSFSNSRVDSAAPPEGSRQLWIEAKRRRMGCSFGKLPVAGCQLPVATGIEGGEAKRQPVTRLSGS